MSVENSVNVQEKVTWEDCFVPATEPLIEETKKGSDMETGAPKIVVNNQKMTIPTGREKGKNLAQKSMRADCFLRY